MGIAEWWSGVSKQTLVAEEQLVRSVALISASLLVASRNVGAEIRGEAVWNSDDVLKASKKYEDYIRGDTK